MKKSIFIEGLANGIPIALGYLVVSFSFGIAAVAEGLTPLQAVIISLTNLTSAGQFAGLGIITGGGSLFELGLSQLVINLRYSLMGVSLSQKLDKSFRPCHSATLGFAMTDEVYAVAVSRTKPVRPLYFLGLAALPYVSWAFGTLVGAVFGTLLPEMVCSALAVAIYGMFIAIIVPKMKTSGSICLITLIAIAISCVIYYVPTFSGISSGFSVIICAVAASAIGAIFLPTIEEDENE